MFQKNCLNLQKFQIFHFRISLIPFVTPAQTTELKILFLFYLLLIIVRGFLPNHFSNFIIFDLKLFRCFSLCKYSRKNFAWTLLLSHVHTFRYFRQNFGILPLFVLQRRGNSSRLFRRMFFVCHTGEWIHRRMGDWRNSFCGDFCRSSEVVNYWYFIWRNGIKKQKNRK